VTDTDHETDMTHQQPARMAGGLVVTAIVEPQTPRVLAEIASERARQDAKWGEQNHPDGTARQGDDFLAEMARAICQANGSDRDNWRDILTEEVHEAYAELDPVRLRAELVQVAAVAVAWVEAIDRRAASQ
jgi:hypothetical protein